MPPPEHWPLSIDELADEDRLLYEWQRRAEIARIDVDDLDAREDG